MLNIKYEKFILRLEKFKKKKLIPRTSWLISLVTGFRGIIGNISTSINLPQLSVQNICFTIKVKIIAIFIAKYTLLFRID